MKVIKLTKREANLLYGILKPYQPSDCDPSNKKECKEYDDTCTLIERLLKEL